MIKIPVSLWIAVPMLLAVSGCEVSTCEGDECDFDSIFDEDGGTSDGGGDQDGGTDEADGGESDGGGSGADGGGSTGEPLSLDEFCEAQFDVAFQWQNKLDDCFCSDFAGDERTKFLAFTFALKAVADCAAERQVQIDAKTVRFEPTKAQACGDAFSKQFTPPAADCPAAGFDLTDLRATQGHGASLQVQLSACRAAFVGLVQKDQPCTDSFECADGRRCITASGSGADANKTCQAAVGEGGTCASFSECADGLTCIGSSASGLVCRSNTDLGLNGANCTADRQCAKGLICDANKCSDGAADVVCEAP